MATIAKTLKALHAAIDDLAATNPECMTALSTILTAATGSDASITVKSARKARRVVKEEPVARSAKATRASRRAKVVDEDEDEDDVESLEDEDEDAPVRRKRVKKTTAKPAAKPTRASRRAKVVDEDEEDEVEAVELESLDEDSVFDMLEKLCDTITVSDKYSSVGIRELQAKLKEFGDDPAEVAGEGTRAERTQSMRTLLSAIDLVIEAIATFGFDAIADAYEQATGEELEVKGSAKAKLAKAAAAYYVAITEAVEDEDGEEEDLDEDEEDEED